MSADRASEAKRRKATTREIAYKKTLLAVYMLSDIYCIGCRATDAQLAQSAGLSLASVASSLRDMAEDRVVVVLGLRDGLVSRMIVLAEEPAGQTFIEHFNRTRKYRRRSRELREARDSA